MKASRRSQSSARAGSCARSVAAGARAGTTRARAGATSARIGAKTARRTARRTRRRVTTGIGDLWRSGRRLPAARDAERDRVVAKPDLRHAGRGGDDGARARALGDELGTVGGRELERRHARLYLAEEHLVRAVPRGAVDLEHAARAVAHGEHPRSLARGRAGARRRVLSGTRHTPPPHSPERDVQDRITHESLLV